MITKRRPVETQVKNARARKRHREHAERLNPSPFVQVFDAHGRPRNKPRHTNVKA